MRGPPTRASRGLGGQDDREVNVGFGDIVDVVGQHVERDRRHDLDHLGVAKAGQTHCGEVGVADAAARVEHLSREDKGGVGLGVARMTGTVQRDLGVVDLGEVEAEIGVRRQAVIAAICLRDCERDAFAGLGVERAAQCAVEAEITLERCGAGADETEEVGDRAELFLDGIEQRLRLCGGISAPKIPVAIFQ